MIAHAKMIPIEDELARRGIVMKRAGRELVGGCVVCGGFDRFSVHLGKRIWNCRGCGKGGDVIDLVQHIDGVTFGKAVEILSGETFRPASTQTPKSKINGNGNDGDYEHRQRAKARWLWSQRQPIVEGTPASKYLHKRSLVGTIPATLAYLPAHGPYPPTMIAAFGAAEESEPGLIVPPKNIVGVHLTRLTAEGDKAPVEALTWKDPNGEIKIEPVKIMLGPSMGCPIVLAPIGDALSLGIVEGIEDGLSVCAAFERSGVWAAGSAGRMPTLADNVPDYVECVTIWAHDDDAGQNGARELAELLDARGVEVFTEGLLP